MLVALVATGSLYATGATAGPVARTLAPDGALFWEGGYVESGTEPFEYPIEVAPGGARLRVAIDTPSREDTFRVDVVAPDGAVAATAENANQFNDEAFVEDPPAGTWLVRVTPAGATLASFRMRAKLEATLPNPGGGGHLPLLPNLRTVPPYELTFTAPANFLNGLYPPDTVNPPLDVAGVHPISCTPDESAPVEAGGMGAVRCLRLTSGPVNVGEGPFDMRFSMTSDAGDGDLDAQYLRGPIKQMIHYADGAAHLRPAGTYIFHTTHAHFHDENILTYELFRVTDAATGALAPAGAGVKSGFCPADQLFGEWDRFVQQPAGYFGEGDTPTGSCMSPDDGVLGLTAGWGDVYRWQRPGQYVEFDGNGDGLYVLRSTVDKGDQILETDETDNASYAFIRVTGEVIDILERGQGSSPWDATKRVFRGPGPSRR